MFPLKGKGFLVWRLDKCLPIHRLIDALKRADASWVSIKMADGRKTFTDTFCHLPDKKTKEIIQELKDNNISVGGWHFIYTRETIAGGLQAATAGERFQKFGLDHWLVDVEELNRPDLELRALWKSGTYRNADAKAYMKQLRGGGVPLSVPVGFMSYRYPRMHPEVPYSAFISHESCNMISPQMYWVHSHNPAQQLNECVEQYDDYAGKYNWLVPIGAAFRESGWESTTDDITEFIDACGQQNLPGCGFWVLDQAINRPEWLDAIAGNAIPEPPEPPEPPVPPEPEGVDMYTWATHVDEWLRAQGYDGPLLLEDSDEPKGYLVEVDTDGANLMIRQKPRENATIEGKLGDHTRVKVYPPLIPADGYDWGYINSPKVGYIATDFTKKV